MLLYVEEGKMLIAVPKIIVKFFGGIRALFYLCKEARLRFGSPWRVMTAHTGLLPVKR